MSSPFLLFFFLLLLLLFSLAGAGAGAGADGGDRAALVGVRAEVADPRGALSSWAGPLGASWSGVGLSNRTGRGRRVVALSVSGASLGGGVPASLCLLRRLEALDLSGNSLSGPLPSCLGALAPTLRSLNLSRNPSLGRGLPLPPWLPSLSNLADLDLSSASFRGAVPAALFALPALRRLDLSHNGALAGALPGGVAAPLELLLLAANRISGTLPCFAAAASRSLAALDLSGNALAGGVPACLSGLRALRSLNLSGNLLSYRLSPRLAFSGRLLALDLSSNRLSGPLPRRIAGDPDRSALILLDLSRNRLSGPVPDEIAGLRSLQGLFLSRNRLSGEIPAGIGNLTYLQALDLSRNRLSGAIPVSLAGCFQLALLDLARNRLSGALRPELDALDSLRVLDLSGNRISGEIPLPLAGCKSLEVVDLSRNQLAGDLSGALLKWQRLRSLSLASNRLSGGLPDWIFSFPSLRWLDLSDNRLAGFIPEDANFNASAEFNGHDDDRSRRRAASPLAGFAAWSSVDLDDAGARQLDLEYSIASPVGIDLSRNAIRGNIPEGLFGMAGLEYLNLSYNNLDGRVPAEMERLERLKWLDLAHNALSGAVPRGGMRRFPGAFAGNPRLCVEAASADCAAEAKMPDGEAAAAAAAAADDSGGGDDGGGGGEKGWVSIGAYWISAVTSFYVSIVTLLCSGKARGLVFRAVAAEF